MVLERKTYIHTIIKRKTDFNNTITNHVKGAESQKKTKTTQYVIEYKGMRYIAKIEVEPKNDKYFREHENTIYHLDPEEGDD